LKAWRPTHSSIGTLMESWNDTLFQRWMEEQTGVHIDWITPVSGTEGDNLAMLISSGEYPDLFFDAGLVYPTGAYGLLKDGVVIDIAKHLDKLPNYKTELERSSVRQIESYSDEGEMASLSSFTQDDIQDATWYGILMRKDMLEKVNMEAPQTYDEWYDVLTAFKKAGLEKPYLLNSDGFPKLNMFIGGLGFGYMNYGGSVQPFYQVDGKIRYAPLEEGFRTYLEMMNKWYSEGLIDQDFLSLNSINAEFAAYPDPRTGSMVAPISVVNVIRELTPDKNVDYIAVPHPVVNKGDKIHVGTESRLVRSGMQISSKTKNLDLALQWADLFYSPDVIHISNYGPDESYYEKLPDGTYRFNEKVYANEDGFAAIDMITSIADSPAVVVSNRTVTDPWLLEQAELYDSINDNAYVISSSLTLNDEESKTYNSVMTNIIDYVEEMQIKFIMGIEKFDNYDAFVERIRGMNVETAMAVYQKALDRYNSR
jgi:putative aldouronate transport system substrate-binding protein